MLKREFEEVKRKIKRFVRIKIGQIIQKEWEKEHIRAILKGEFPKLKVSEFQIAENIMQWCSGKREPVSFFLECLEIMGIKGPVIIEKLEKKEAGNSVILKEKVEEKTGTLYIVDQKRQKYLRSEAMDIKVQYYILNIGDEVILEIVMNKIKVRYCTNKTIEIILGKNNEVYFIIKGITWDEKSDLYNKAINFMEELEIEVETAKLYDCYLEIKKVIAKYYNLENAEINMRMHFNSITTQNGQLIEYQDSIAGVIIINHHSKGYYYKKYNSNGIEVVWERGYIKVSGESFEKAKKHITAAEEAIAAIEKLEF